MNTVEILRELGVAFVEHHRSVRHGWLGIPQCPYCGHGDCYFAFTAGGRSCSCWACGAKPFNAALVKLSGRRYAEIRELAGGTDFDASTGEGKPTGRYLPPSAVQDYLPKPHRDYLKSRKIDVGTAWDVFGVRGVNHAGGRHAWSLLLPVTLNGRPVSWTTRKIGETSIRYDSAPPNRETVPIKRTLYGGDLARGTAVVCEGPMDALRVGPGAVATFGAQVTPQQVAKIAKYPRRVICFDSAGDATGEREGERLAELLAPQDGETVLVTLDAKDAAEASDAEIARLRRLFLD